MLILAAQGEEGQTSLIHNSRQPEDSAILLPAMPGQQLHQIRGLLFKVTPIGWHRRRLRFPFFFEQSNYSFVVGVGRLAPEEPNDPWPNDEIAFAILFEDGSMENRSIPVPPVPMNKATTMSLENVYVPVPGQTKIVILTNPDFEQKHEKPTFVGLYSYRVRTEESLWVSAAVATFAAISLFSAIFVPICTARLNKPPVVNNNIILGATSTHTGEAAQGTPTPAPGAR